MSFHFQSKSNSVEEAVWLVEQFDPNYKAVLI